MSGNSGIIITRNISATKNTNNFIMLRVENKKPYKNTTKRCMLCLQENLAIITYPNHNDLLNKGTELISKCRHQSKYLLKNYDTKD